MSCVTSARPSRNDSRRTKRFSLIIAGLGLTLLPCLASADDPRMTSISIAPTSAQLVPGQTQAFQATGTYSDDSVRDVTTLVSWKSSRTGVATIDASGVATARGSGETEISARDPASGVSSRTKIKLQVAKLRSLSLTPLSKVVRVGHELQVRAIGAFENGPSDVDVSNLVTWSTSKDDVATVGPGTASGVPAIIVIGVGSGTTTITATDPVTRVRSSNSEGEVVVVGELESIALNPVKRALRVGETTRYHAIGTFERGAKIEITNDVQWSVSDATIASIVTSGDSPGRARGLQLGDTAVSATDRITGVSSTDDGGDVPLAVVGAMTSLAVSPAVQTLTIGAQSDLKALAMFEGRSDSFSLGSRVSWTSSNPAVVRVDPPAAAHCVEMGTAVISARDPFSGFSSTSSGGDGTITCAGNVIAIRVAPAERLLQPGRSRQMKGFRVFDSGGEVKATRQMIWSSDTPKVISVVREGSSAGRATALRPGSALISAFDPTSGLSSDDPGGTSSVLGVPGTPEEVTIFPRNPVAGTVGTPIQFRARLEYKGGLTQGVNALVTWSSSDESIATVSNGDDGHPAGFAQLLQPGTVTVSVVYPKIEPTPTPGPDPTPTPTPVETPAASGTPQPTPTEEPEPLTDEVTLTVSP